MYPQFPFLGITIHIFGLTLAVGLVMFLWISYRLIGKVQTDRAFVTQNIAWFILAGAVASRLAFFISEWREYKFLFSEGSWFQAIFMTNYNLSLAGAVLGFAGLFVWQSRSLRKRDRLAMIDIFVLAFLFSATVVYVGALLGGQVYGISVPSNSSWGITYSHPATPVPGDLPRFPLAAIYAVIAFGLFCTLYIAHILTHLAGLIGYAGVVIFASILLVGEFFNGDTDMFKSIFLLNLNQLVAVVSIFIGLRGMLLIAKNG